MYCEFEACRTCCQTYITNNRTAKCMNNECEKEWTRKFLVASFTKKFVNHAWKETLETIGLEREKALLPETQGVVEQLIERERVRKEIEEVDDLIRELYNRRANLNTQYQQGGNARTATEKKHFTRACPAEHCRGFLSTQWKCGLCDQWTCPDCHVVKGPHKDSVHVCNKDDLETAKLLAKDTKPCPKCATGIYKIEGCFAKDTPIRMWDGSLKMSQDITETDVLVGDDGHPRIVEHIVSGEDDLYEIIQSYGMTYTVNSKHKLVLLYVMNKQKNTRDSSIVEICVDDYLKLDKSLQKNLFGYKSSKGIDKDYLRTNIEVAHVGKGKYYGWSVNENKRFILDDFTVVRNCDQMWCTQCHTAFSWRTGRIETHIHNPHYYEWQRRNNGGVAPRNVGDFQCGREINHYTARHINTKVRDIYMENNHCSKYVRPSRYHDNRTTQPSETPVMDQLTTRIDNIVRTTLHIQRVQMPTYQVDQIEDNLGLRVDYLRNRITEDEFKVRIQRANKQHQKKREIGEIIHLFVQSITDILYRVNDCVDNNRPKCETSFEQDALHKEITTILDEIEPLLEYTDECFTDISKTYGCKQRAIRMYNDRDRYRDVLITV